MATKRLAVFDPSGRLTVDLEPAAGHAHVTLVDMRAGEAPTGVAAILVAPAVATELPPLADQGAPRWIVGDANNAARVAGAAAGAGAAGVLLTPVSAEALAAAASAELTALEVELARARGLIATSLVGLTGQAADTLKSVADRFSAHDCIVWWKDGSQMAPTAARDAPADGYRSQIAAAARVAAAAAGTVFTGGPSPRAVIADALRTSATEVGGLVAIISDTARRFSAAERTDLKALAARLTRELSWLTSHRRLVAEGERLLASSLHDPLTGAMTRGAFEQTISHEVAGASRRQERLTLAVIDVVGLRRINLGHGHEVGDEVLAQIAGRLRATVRGNDPIGRLGGDELAVLLVGANAEQAGLVVRKLIQRVQSETIALADDNQLSIQVRAVLTEISPGERSGEAALARCYSALRIAPTGEARIVDPGERPADDGSALDTGSVSAGTVLGGTYRVVHELSRGAMGVVYRGEDLGLNRQVAIKVLRSDLASDRDLVARFRAEAGLLASLHHKNLVQVYALGEQAGDVYFVMELVEGQPLSDVLRATLERKEWFPILAIAQITLEIGDALDAMHAIGVIHRDVKPANILLDRERDRAVLVDVGVAQKAGDQRDAAGTPGFAAPESFLEQAGGPSTDVYGLAATVYCMLTGRPPYGSGPAPQVVHRQLNDQLTPPSKLRPGISEAIDAVLAKALAPNPKKRWTSASTFAIALGRALERISDTPLPLRVPPPVIDDPGKAAESLLEPTTGMSPEDQARVVSFNAPASPGSSLRSTSGGLAIGRVRAAHLRVLSKILQTQLGEHGMAKLMTEAPALSAVLSPTLPPLAWVELVELVVALEHARTLMPNGLVPRKVGRGTMSATFPRLFGADPASLPIETVLAALPSYWSRYHDWGDIEMSLGTAEARVALAGSSGAADVCTMVGAELERICELAGAHAVATAHPNCRHINGARCEFRLTWIA